MKKKITLKKLKVESFVTSENLEKADTIKGGTLKSKPACNAFSDGPECTKPTTDNLCSRFATACGSCPPYCQAG